VNTSARLEWIEFGLFCGRHGLSLGLAEALVKAARAHFRAAELQCSCPDESTVDRATRRADRLTERALATAWETGVVGLELRISHNPRGPVLWACINDSEYPVPDRG